jgi:hypothetical protein
MVQITEDLVLGSKFALDRGGGVLMRVFEVSGLVPGQDTLAQAALAQDGTSGARIPLYGEQHPNVVGLFAETIEAEPVKNSRTAAVVKVRYASPEFSSVPNVVTLAINGSNRAKLMSRDPSDGSLLTVQYTDPSGNSLKQIMQVPVLSPNTILTFTRQEIKSPLKTSIALRRKVNSAPWQAGDVKTWLCRAIDARSLGNLTRYEVKYVFEYDPDGWDRIEYYKDPFTGRVPDDAALSTNNDQGAAKVLLYGTADFNQLGLPNAF